MKLSWLGQSKLEAQVQEYQKQVQELRLTVIDILTGTKTVAEEDSGNQYTDKKLAVEAIYRKYRNEDEWGCQILQRIINHRKSMVLPYGVQVVAADGYEGDADDEVAFVEAFLAANDFDNMEDVLCRQSEMEGEVLLLLEWKGEAYQSADDVKYDGMPMVSRRLWAQKQWEVYLDKNDPDKIAKIEWKNGTGAPTVLKPGEPWVLGCFNATQFNPDFAAATAASDMKMQGMPVAAFCLTNCENLDKGMVNWRKVNKYFANLTPFLLSESPSETAAIQAQVEKGGWRVGKLMIGRDFKMVGPGADVSQQIYQEVRANAQIISAATGIPIHHIGFPDVVGQGRSTAREMVEPMEVISLNDMSVWFNFYRELFSLAIGMANKELPNLGLDPKAVEPKLLPSGSQAWDKIERVWLPAAVNGLVSRELFLKQLPDIDVEEELGGEVAEQNAEEVAGWLGQGGQQVPSEGAYSKAQGPGETATE